MKDRVEKLINGGGPYSYLLCRGLLLKENVPTIFRGIPEGNRHLSINSILGNILGVTSKYSGFPQVQRADGFFIEQVKDRP